MSSNGLQSGGVAQTVGNALIKSLKALEATADMIPVPALKAALDVVLYAVDVVKVRTFTDECVFLKVTDFLTFLQKTMYNAHDMDQLITKLESLRTTVLDPLRGEKLTDSTIKRIEKFAEQVFSSSCQKPAN
jgi:hypothetical protein